mmetsp:Transcript_2057/g.4187  ORF Transcript_2057/g.4187 Transcript_2057/m.4187 type:complete len:421 (+) Transcript_2057:240-1502(+)
MERDCGCSQDRHWAWVRLVAVGGGLVGAVDGDTNVVSLVLREHGEVGAQLAKVEVRDLLVELLGQQVHLVTVLHLGLVLASLVVGAAQLELSKRLVGERVGHDEGGVASGTAEVEEAALGEDDDAVAIGEDVLVALRLDVHARGGLLELRHLDLVVEVANVADDGVVLHLRHVLAGDDVFVAGGGDEDVGIVLLDAVLECVDLVALHASLQRADRVDLRHVGDRSLGRHRGSGALADIAKAADDDLLAREHNVGGAHNAVGQRVAAAVHVVKLRLGDAVVHVDGGEHKLALVSHGDQAVDTRRRLLRDTDHARNHAGEAGLVLGDRALDCGKHALELGIVGGRRVGERAVLGEGLLELLALVEEERGITTVVNDLVHALTVRPVEGLIGAPPVLLKSLALPGEDVSGASAHDGRRGVVLR